MNILVKFSILLIKFYKNLISPFLLKSCRYDPSCSSYAMEAFNVFGFVIGLKLTVKRIIRCHPWGGHCLLYTSPSPRDPIGSRMPSSA